VSEKTNTLLPLEELAAKANPEQSEQLQSGTGQKAEGRATRRCSVRGCINMNFNGDLCSAHYSRLARHGDVMPDVPVGARYHGHDHSPEHRTWVGMRQRCFQPKNPKYHRYGGRGITVCERWNASFMDFLSDMGTKPPSGNTSINRINNDGHYSCGLCDQCITNGWPMNCEWATPTTQGRNKHNNRVLTLKGESATLSEWAERLNVTQDFLHNRIHRGWSDERTLTEPPHDRGQQKIK
jgi:hypothetical protein